MKIVQNIKYDIKKSILIAGLTAGSVLIPATCNRVDATNDAKRSKRHNIELKFCPLNYSEICADSVKKYALDPRVGNVLLVPRDDGAAFGNWNLNCIQALRQSLQELISFSPQKVQGRGNLQFLPGEASRSPADSLWFVQNGWTVNRYGDMRCR